MSQFTDKEIITLRNKIYKILPEREENKDWEKTLDEVLTLLAGLLKLTEETSFGIIYMKLSGLGIRGDTIEQKYFRKTIFDCLNLL